MRIGAALIIFFLLYTYLWIGIFSQKVTSQIKSPFAGVLSASARQKPTEIVSTSDSTPLPSAYSLSLGVRKQVFNLSCEFEAASAILYYFTKSPAFLAQNEETAEKMLMAKIGTSQNPNIGIRMGEIENENSLYTNLNKSFGGSVYYGVHAPPFIDVFSEFNLTARPLIIQNNNIELVKQSISQGHLIMTWLNVGYGQPVDVALSYGDVSVVKGEHTVVIYGYDETGVFIMDPGNGSYKHVLFDHLLQAVSLFSMPFLEVYPSTAQNSLDPTGPIDAITKLNRGVIKVLVRNGSKETGAAQKMVDILKDFGYTVMKTENADNFDSLDVSINMKKSIADYKSLIKKDIMLAQYTISNLALNLSASESADVVITVGR